VTDAVEQMLTVERLAFGGDGVGRLDGKVCFVPGVAPDEQVAVTITEERKNFCRARLNAVRQSSPHRIVPGCPLAGNGCPGCVYQHLDYPTEVAAKHGQLQDLFRRLGGIDPAPVLLPPQASAQDHGYRNKLTLHVQRQDTQIKLGYFMADNRTVLDLPSCPLAVPELNQLLAAKRNEPDFLAGLTDGANVTFRWTPYDGAQVWPTSSPPPAWLRESTPGGDLSVPANSFFQVNPAASGLLFQAVQELLRPLRPERFIDLYCGVGFFSLAAAALGVPEVTGIESDSEAVSAAGRNLQAIPGCRAVFSAGRVEQTLRHFTRNPLPPTAVLLVDPPRTGLLPEALRALLRWQPRELIYVSCAPDTLCRDLKLLLAGGYELESVRMVDMFPRTAHFETISWLTYHG